MNQGKLVSINANADGYRLLSEAEWEWLARKAGRPSQTLFSWGNSTTLPPKAANIADESAKSTVREYVPRYDDGQPGIAPVMSMQAELSGLYDMGGNVSEWTHDSYTLTLPKSSVNYSQQLDKTVSDHHVVKGASYLSGSITTLRPSYREGQSAAQNDLGFRLGRFVYGGE